jgi:hypothetical protein
MEDKSCFNCFYKIVDIKNGRFEGMHCDKFILSKDFIEPLMSIYPREIGNREEILNDEPCELWKKGQYYKGEGLNENDVDEEQEG